MGSRPCHSPMLSAGDTLSFLCPHLMHFSHRIPVTLCANATSESRPGQGTPNNQSQPPAPLSGTPQCSTNVLVAVVSLEDSFQGVGDGQVTPEALAGSRNSFCSYHLGFSLVGPSGPLPRETTPTPNCPVWNEVMPTRPGDNSYSP